MVAAIGAGVAALSAGAQIYGSSQQAGAAQGGQNVELQMFNQLQGLLKPYVTAGGSALPSLQALLGLGPNGSAGIQSTLENLPGFQFDLNQGLKSTQNGFGARGLGVSGAAMKGADQYATGLASNNYSSFLGQLQNLAGMGESAAAGTGTAGQNAGGIIAQLMQQGATATAAGTTGAANSLGQGGLLYSLLNGQQNTTGNLSGGFNGTGQNVVPSGQNNPFSLTDGSGNLLAA